MALIHRGSQEEYNRILDEFGAGQKQPQQCIRYLANLGYTDGQAHSAVYEYPVDKGLIGT